MWPAGVPSSVSQIFPHRRNLQEKELGVPRPDPRRPQTSLKGEHEALRGSGGGQSCLPGPFADDLVFSMSKVPSFDLRFPT